jgi:hypothetical protein
MKLICSLSFFYQLPILCFIKFDDGVNNYFWAIFIHTSNVRGEILYLPFDILILISKSESNRFEPAPVQVLLTEEISGSLRQLKVTSFLFLCCLESCRS